MQFYIDLFFPINFATLWGRRVFLTIAVFVVGFLYLVVQYFFADSVVWDADEEVSTEKLILDVQTAEKKSQTLAISPVSLLLRRSAFVVFLRNVFKFKPENTVFDDDFDENIESLVIADGFESHEQTPLDDTLDTETRDEKHIEDTIMTEANAKKIDNLTRSNIQREEFESELNYLKKKQKREELEKKLIEWLAQDNAHTAIIEHLSQYYIDQNQHKKALPLLKRLLDQDADNHKVLRQMSDIYLMMEDIETSEVLVKRALSLNPNNPKYAITLVEIYYNTKRKDTAITLMEDIVKRRPDNLWYRDTLAKLYEEMRDYDLAIECYQSMLMIDPKNITIKRRLLETRTKVEK